MPTPTHTHSHNKTHHTMPLSNTMSIPVAFESNNNKDATFGHLQQKMMDMGWELFVNDNTNTTYFKHKTYGQRHFNAHAVKTSKNTYIFPIVSQTDDPKGLGCSFIVHYGSGNSEIVSNEWTSYWDTRKGRRREHYLNYLHAREEKKKQIEEEERKSQAQLKKATSKL